MAFQRVVLIALLMSSCASMILAQCLTENDKQVASANPDTKTRLTEGRLKFALETLKTVAEIESQGNVFFSPHSLHQALSLMYFGSRRQTEQNLKKALGIPEDLSKVDVLAYFSNEKADELSRQENSTANYEIRIANKLWITDAKKIRECILDYFHDDLVKTNFKTDPEGARKRINEWVSNTTKGNIQDLIPEKSIDSVTDLVLANAIYFKGLWQRRFDPANSKRDIFYTSHNNAVLTTFMRQKGSFSHGVSEELGAHILELPYKGEEISMFILLPPFVSARSRRDGGQGQKTDGLHQLIHRITNTERGFNDLRQIFEEGMMSRDVEVTIPKFSIEGNIPVKQLLQAVGAGEAISQNADLTGFLEEGEGNLHLGDVSHRAKIEVSEEGTTAAAATALFSFRSSRPIEPAIFKANHPFVYVIYDNQAQSVLFTGIFRKPVQVEEVAVSA